MADRRFQYQEPGTLEHPGPIGRIVRLVLGAACLSVVLSIAMEPSPFFSGRSLDAARAWLVILLGLCAFPDVVSIGFGRTWKRRWILAALGSLGIAAALAGRVMYGSAAAPPLGTLVSIWLLYTFGHLGVSFVLAALLATPGCEMRAIPHLLTLISGNAAREHYCPGLLTPIDRWETTARSGRRHR